MSPREDTCQSCGAPIVWAGTLKGKRMPLDRQPDPDEGDYLVAAAKSPNGALLAIRITNLNGKAREAAKRHGVQLRTSHFGTCPDREKWSGTTRKERDDGKAIRPEAGVRAADPAAASRADGDGEGEAAGR
jgi:hypothetical protein